MLSEAFFSPRGTDTVSISNLEIAMYIRKAAERGHADHGWLNSHHSFSFANYYDPAHMGFSNLRVINDDIVQPGMGFGTHGHQDMEIISYVIDGELAHKDSEGNVETIPAGDIQIMSAGTGIQHSEFNASDKNLVNFLQIWVLPKRAGIAPRYEQKTITQTDVLTPIVMPGGSDTAVDINADAALSQLVLDTGESIDLGRPDQHGYLHVVKGQAETSYGELAPGDAIGLEPGEAMSVTASEPLTALWFDLP